MVTYSGSTLLGLKQAFYKFDRQIGKYNKDQALTLLKQLELTPEAEAIVRRLVLEAFAQDAFAGYLRLGAVSNRLQAHAVRAGEVSW